jgi:hypothetical protein
VNLELLTIVVSIKAQTFIEAGNAKVSETLELTNLSCCFGQKRFDSIKQLSSKIGIIHNNTVIVTFRLVNLVNAISNSNGCFRKSLFFGPFDVGVTFFEVKCILDEPCFTGNEFVTLSLVSIGSGAGDCVGCFWLVLLLHFV